MNITLLTYGSEGDVQPFVELGKGLVVAGHHVTLAAPAKFEILVKEEEITFIAFPGDPQQMVQDLIEKAGNSWWRMVRSMSSNVLPLGLEVSHIAREVCQNADLIVHSFLMTNTGYEIARELDIPDTSVQTFPVFTSTGAFPAPVAPDLPLGNFYRRLTHNLVTQIFWQGSRIIYRQIRKNNPKLPPLTTWPFDPDNVWQTPILYAFSPSVVPRPRDWRKGVHITGYWFSDDDRGWKPDTRLVKFLEKGPTPIAVAFGSTSTSKLDEIYHKVVTAIKMTDQRGIIVGNKPDDLDSEGIFWHEGYIPYDWLFKRSAAAIHHGGAGTTGKALRAGIPNIILPFTSDQPFWGRQVYKLGAGPKPIPPKRLTTAKLTKAIEFAINDHDMNRCAKTISENIINEDGVIEAVIIIDRLVL